MLSALIERQTRVKERNITKAVHFSLNFKTRSVDTCAKSSNAGKDLECKGSMFSKIYSEIKC